MAGFFEALDQQVKADATVRLLISRKTATELYVALVPDGSDASQALSVGLCISATPEELDLKFGEALAAHLAARADIADDIAATTAAMQAQAEAERRERESARANGKAAAAKPVGRPIPTEAPAAANATADTPPAPPGEDLFGLPGGTAPPATVADDDNNDETE